MQLKVTWMNLKLRNAKSASLSEDMITDGGGLERMLQQKEYTVINCPICGNRIADRLASYKIEIRKISKNNVTRWKPDIKEKCKRCKSELGIKIQ